MSGFFNILMILLMLADFALLASSRIGACVNLIVLQGLIIGLVPFCSSTHPSSIVIAMVIILVKAILFPTFLRRALRSVIARREMEPLVGYTASILIGLAAILLSFWLCRNFSFPHRAVSQTGTSAAIFTMFTGLFLIIARVKALTQVIGYIVFENGIYALGSSLMLEQGLLVELGIILDVLVFVLVMGIMTFHINKAFDHIDTDNLIPVEPGKENSTGRE